MFYLYDPLSALVVILYGYLLAHGIIPLNAENIASAFLFLVLKHSVGVA